MKGAVCLICSPSQRQSSLLFRRVLQLYKAQGSLAPAAVSEQALQLKLGPPVNSFIAAIPGSESTTRGYASVSCLVTDESQFLEDTLWYSLTPATSTVPASKIICIGTPHGKRGYFHHTFTEKNNWLKFEVKSEDVERIPKAWLAEERARLGAFYPRAYEVSWDSLGGGGIFRPEAIRRCITNDDNSLEVLLNSILDGEEPAQEEDLEFEINELNLNLDD